MRTRAAPQSKMVTAPREPTLPLSRIHAALFRSFHPSRRIRFSQGTNIRGLELHAPHDFCQSSSTGRVGQVNGMVRNRLPPAYQEKVTSAATPNEYPTGR